MQLQFTHPDGSTEPIQNADPALLWNRIVSDDAFEWGLTTNSRGAIERVDKRKVERRLSFSKHPDGLWHFQIENCRTQEYLTTFDSSCMGDSSWADAYLNASDVCIVDESGNAYVKMAVGGAEYHILHACFVTPSTATAVFFEFLRSGNPLPELNWVSQASIDAIRYIG